MNSISSTYATPSSEGSKEHFIISFQTLLQAVFLFVFLFEATRIWLTMFRSHRFVSICHSYLKQSYELTYDKIDCGIKR